MRKMAKTVALRLADKLKVYKKDVVDEKGKDQRKKSILVANLKPLVRNQFSQVIML
jgi:hypothetical protein